MRRMRRDAVPVTLGVALGAVAMLGSGCANHHGSGKAVESASTAWSCPKDRIAVVSEAAPTQAAPPADVAADPAADPARLAIGKKHLPDPDSHRVFVLSGCGNTGSFQCSLEDYYWGSGPHTSSEWFCSLATEISLRSRTTRNGLDSAASPEALEALAAQIDASGQGVVAQSLRAKARQLRAAGPSAGKSHEVSGVGVIGDPTARINAPDVVHLPLHSEVPTPPVTLKGLRVLIVSELNGDAAYKAAASSKTQCDQGAVSLTELVGWVGVSDSSQPHDLVMRAECTSLAGNRASDGALYLLKPLNVRGPRFETPEGQLIDQIAPSGSTFACPVSDEDKCLAAASEYATAYFVNSVAHSAKLADYVTHHANPR